MGIPMPEDVTLIAGGVLTYYGICDVWLMIVVGLLGVMAGDTLIFWLGHHFGRKLLKRWPFRLIIDETKIESIRIKLHDHGGKVLFSARFMPGLRSTVFFCSGLLHIPYRKLLIYDGCAALISVPTIIYSVYYFGDYIEHVIRMIKKVEGGIVTLIAVAIAFFIIRHFIKKRKGSSSETPV